MKKQNWFIKTILAGALCFPMAMSSFHVNAVTGTPTVLEDRHTKVFGNEYGFSPRFIKDKTEVLYRGFTDRQDLAWQELGSQRLPVENVLCISLKDEVKGKPQILYKNVGNWHGKEIGVLFTVKNWTLLNSSKDNARGNLPCAFFNKTNISYRISSYTQKNTVTEAKLVYTDGKSGFDYEEVEDTFKWHWTVCDLDGEAVDYGTNNINADGTKRRNREALALSGSYTAYVSHGDQGEIYDNSDNKPAVQNKIESVTSEELPNFVIYRQKSDGTYNNGVNNKNTIGQITMTIDKPCIDMSFRNELYLGGQRRGQSYCSFTNEALGKFDDPVPFESVNKEKVHLNEEVKYSYIMNSPIESNEFYYPQGKLKTTLPNEVEIAGDNPFTISVSGGLSEEDKQAIEESLTYNAETKEVELNIPESILGKPEFYGSEIVMEANVKVAKKLDTAKTSIENNCNLTTRSEPKESNTVSVQVVHDILTSVNGEGGTITPTAPEILNGTDKEVVVQSVDGYVVGEVLVDGVALTGVGMHTKNLTYAFDKVDQNHKVEASFIKEPKTTVEKTADKSEYAIGERIVYTIHLVNAGEASEEITLHEHMPTGIEIESVTGGELEKTFTLAGGETKDITITTKPLTAEMNGKVSTNEIEVQGSYTGKITDTVDTWTNEPNLHIEKSLEQTKVAEGDRVKYTVILTQTVKGTLTARNVVLKDSIAGDTGEVEQNSLQVYVNGEKLNGTDDKITYNKDKRGYEFRLGDLKNNDEVKLEYYVNVLPTEADKLVNKVEVTSDNTTEKTFETTTNTPIQHKYTISTSVIGGTITQVKDKVLQGSNLEIEYSGDNGKYLYSVSVDGQEVNVQDYLNKVSFTNIQENHAVNVVYKDIPTTKYTFNKVWKDNANKNNTRPDSVSVKVVGSNGFEQTYELTNDNNWTIETQDLPLKQPNGQDITYTVNEVEIPNYHSQMNKLNDTYTFTNTVYGEKEVVVNIEWETPDTDTIPNEVEIALTGNGKSFANKVNTNTTTHQTTSFTVPAYDVDGNEIDYIATENAVKDYTTTYPDKTTVHNKYDPEMKTLTVTKNWLDNNNAYNTRPTELTFKIFRNGLPFTSVSVSAPLWQAEVNVPCSDKSGAEYQYSIEEQEVSGYESKVEEFVATNTLVGLTEKTVHIVYEGVSEENEPETVEVQLKANEKVIQTQTIDKTKEYTFKELPKYDENGTEIVYTVEEVKIGEEEVKNNSTRLFEVNYSEDTFTITNSRKDRKVKCFIEVLWNDYENEDNTRPGTRKGTLTRNDGEVIEFELTKDKEWKVIVEDLESEDETGTPYTYTLSMDGIEKYEDVVKGEFNSYKVVSTYRRQPKPVEEPQAPTEKEEKEEPVKGMPTGVEPNNIVVAIGALGVLLTLWFISGIYEKWKTRK